MANAKPPKDPNKERDSLRSALYLILCLSVPAAGLAFFGGPIYFIGAVIVLVLSLGFLAASADASYRGPIG